MFDISVQVFSKGTLAEPESRSSSQDPPLKSHHHWAPLSARS